jgi:putative transposase
MLFAHRIRLDPAPVQRDYFARAAGAARRVWNWALAEWQRQVAAGQRPNAMLLKKQFNAIKYAHPDWLDAEGQPWLRAIHRDAHSQPFANLAKAWRPYFAALCEHRPTHRPVFKKKGHCRDSFYVANDKLRLDVNAAINLKRLATGACAAQSALPVASLAATPGTAAGMGSAGDGKVTPARHEHGRSDGSGQEQNDAHCRAHF